MPARVATYPSSGGSRYAIGLVLLVFSILGGALLAGFAASFLWPPEASVPAVRRVNAGRISRFKVGEPQFLSVTKDGRVFNSSFGITTPSSEDVLIARFWVVRTSDDHFIAINWKDPRGCTIPWRPDFAFTNPATNESTRGWFRDPCGGSTYDIQGRRVSGPSPRDLDRYPVYLSGSSVLVKVGDGALMKGGTHYSGEPFVQY